MLVRELLDPRYGESEERERTRSREGGSGWLILFVSFAWVWVSVDEGMWLTDEDSGLCWFNPGASYILLCCSKEVRVECSSIPLSVSFFLVLASLESAEQYTLIGVVVGLAVYHASVLDIPLPGAAFKRLLNKPVTIDDLAEWQPALARGLKSLLKFEGDVEATYCRSFVGEVSRAGLVRFPRTMDEKKRADSLLPSRFQVRVLRRDHQCSFDPRRC